MTSGEGVHQKMMNYGDGVEKKIKDHKNHK